MNIEQNDLYERLLVLDEFTPIDVDLQVERWKLSCEAPFVYPNFPTAINVDVLIAELSHDGEHLGFGLFTNVLSDIELFKRMLHGLETVSVPFSDGTGSQLETYLFSRNADLLVDALCEFMPGREVLEGVVIEYV